MFKILSDLLTELFASRPDVEPNSKPLAMPNFQPKLDIAFSRFCQHSTTSKRRTVAARKYPGYEPPVASDSGLDFSL